MIEISSIRTFEDRGFQRGMVRASAVVAVAGAVLGAAWFFTGAPGALGLPPAEVGAVVRGEGPCWLGLPPLVWWLACGAAGCFAALAAHELVHGVLFRLFAPAGARVSFGADWKAGMLYACAEDVVYTRAQYLVIALAPTVVVTALLLLLGMASGWPVLWYAVAVLHLSGCTGDWGYVAAIARDPRIMWCEDTEWGVRFYGEGEAPREAASGAEVRP